MNTGFVVICGENGKRRWTSEEYDMRAAMMPLFAVNPTIGPLLLQRGKEVKSRVATSLGSRELNI